MSMNNHEESQIIPLSFSQDIDEELRKLNAEMRMMNILTLLASERQITEEDRADLRHLMLILADLFSSSIPPIEDEPMDMLKLAARDIRLATLLRERGLARIYRLTTLQTKAYDELTRQFVLLPAFMQQVNPDTNVQYKSQEEFIGWFCKEAMVPRSLVFQRMRVYDRLQTIGMTLEEAFDVILQKPFAAPKALKEVSTWQKDQLVDIDPDVAVRLVTHSLPERIEHVEALVETMQTSDNPLERDEAMQELLEEVKPALRNLVVEVAGHQKVSDALDMVTHDIGGKPEIKYWYDGERGFIHIEYAEKGVDVRGTSYVKQIHQINLVPEEPLSEDILRDLAKRLNFTNRDLYW